MKLRLFSILVMAIAAFTVAGCERPETGTFTAEVDEPGYRRGKELLRQTRNQEALAEFQKVLDKRGLANSPETHLELGLLYHRHIRDPIAAIYHFRKFRELKPNTQQADLVRQQIEAATREFASTLPGRPMDNPAGAVDASDIVQRVTRENEQLRQALAAARVAAGFGPRPAVDAAGNLSISPEGEEVPAGEGEPAASPISASPTESQIFGSAAPLVAEGGTEERPSLQSAPETAPGLFRMPTQSSPAQVGTANKTVAKPTPAPGGGRRHVVKTKESLYSIARQYYGSASNSRVEELFQANRDQLKSKTDLKVGMELKVP